MLRQYHPQKRIDDLCKLLGKSRQAYYQHVNQENRQTLTQALILRLVMEIRATMPKTGTRKLLHLLSEPLERHKISIGRDQLFELLRAHNLLIRQRRRGPKTTNSWHRFHKYENLIQGLAIQRPEQVWVSDITYLQVADGFSYLSLITDAYSHKIMGYYLHTGLQTLGPVKALQMALPQRSNARRKLIHHSDRGFQYCCDQYVEILQNQRIDISMTQNGDPYENAIAERVNGILKMEFGLGSHFQSHEQAVEAVQQAVAIYNEQRPHASCDFLTPEQAHFQEGELKKRWKNYPARKKQVEKVVKENQDFNALD